MLIRTGRRRDAVEKVHDRWAISSESSAEENWREDTKKKFRSTDVSVNLLVSRDS